MARNTRRPKGYIEWNPTDEVLYWVIAVRQILQEYASYGPMTVRQIFYRLVAQWEYPKTERAYKRLAEYLVKARRSGHIGFGSIRDDGTVEHGITINGIKEFWDQQLDYATKKAWRNRQQGQDYHIEMWCEAGGMAPMLAGMLVEWTIPVYSTGGFSSVTVVHEVAERVLSRDAPTVFLHVGDYDPSGQSIFESMAEDIGAFVAADTGEFQAPSGDIDEFMVEGYFEPRRVALVREQVARYNLPTAPAKASDSRSANWYDTTTQAEALPPDLLQDIVRDAVREYINVDQLDQTKADEQKEIDVIAKHINEAPRVA